MWSLCAIKTLYRGSEVFPATRRFFFLFQAQIVSGNYDGEPWFSFMRRFHVLRENTPGAEMTISLLDGQWSATKYVPRYQLYDTHHTS